MCVKWIKKSIKGALNNFGWILNSVGTGFKDDEISAHVIFAGVLGLCFGGIFCLFDLEMSKEAWFYVFSALSQTLAAFIAFCAMLFILRLGDEREAEQSGDRSEAEQRRREFIAEMNVPYSIMVTSIILSITLITFGQINAPTNWIANDYFKFLKYGISFFTISFGMLGMLCVGKMIWESRRPNL